MITARCSTVFEIERIKFHHKVTLFAEDYNDQLRSVSQQ